jgi:polyhydroxyalkanoate synthesis regulator phasin
MVHDDSALLHGKPYDTKKAREDFLRLMPPDDSGLLHGGTYDPQKAREYYLRTRQLKGRKGGGGSAPSGGKSNGPSPSVGSKKSTSNLNLVAKGRQAVLEKRLGQLKEKLAQLVAKAKGRSGVEKKTDAPTKAADKGGSKAKGSDLSAKEKKEKAAKARAEYEKVKSPAESDSDSATEQIEKLRGQIQDIQEQIKKAIQDARK